MDPVIASAIFILGLAFGSFLNVCIYRLPLGISVVTPRSACPQCKHPIALYDNIPILSWLILKGRCRECKARISPRYLTIELLTRRMRGEQFPPVREVLPLELIVRRSCGTDRTGTG